MYTHFETPIHVGVDEVGRGCLAGPVVSCALVLKNKSLHSRLKDSKVLTPKKREELSLVLQTEAFFAIGMATVEEIDTINILQATFLSMKRAVTELNQKIALKDSILLIDGPYQIPNFEPYIQLAVIDGDAKVEAISAASIIAKVYRDQLMREYEAKMPGFFFDQHKGYGTKVHRKAIAEMGPTSIHRKTFRGVKEFLS